MSDMRFFDTEGNRPYLNGEERAAFLKATATYDPEARSFAEMLAFTGCRISEALEVVRARLDVDGHKVIFRSLKKRRDDVYRAVPVPPAYMDSLQRTFSIRQAQKRKNAKTERLWPWHRQHGWRLIKAIMAEAHIAPGCAPVPQGLAPRLWHPCDFIGYSCHPAPKMDGTRPAIDNGDLFGFCGRGSVGFGRANVDLNNGPDQPEHSGRFHDCSIMCDLWTKGITGPIGYGVHTAEQTGKLVNFSKKYKSRSEKRNSENSILDEIVLAL